MHELGEDDKKNIKALQNHVVTKELGIKVGDTVRPKKKYRQRNIDHSGVVVRIHELSLDIKLKNGNVMKDVAASYFEKIEATE